MDVASLEAQSIINMLCQGLHMPLRSNVSQLLLDDLHTFSLEKPLALDHSCFQHLELNQTLLYSIVKIDLNADQCYAGTNR